MLSKTRLKFIKSLQIKKYRKQEGVFLVEGAKSVLELIHSNYKISSILLTEEFLKCCAEVLSQRGIESYIVKAEELSRAGTFESNNAAIAIVEMKENKPVYPSKGEYILVLDEIKDPGNLGTIIRIADWYGIDKIICSENTAEFYNPKVISATMGSFTRVTPYYCSLKEYFSGNELPVYGAFLGGEDVHNVKFNKEGFIVMGNESNGISFEVESFVGQKITIPKFGKAESLNVGVATAIILDNLKRDLL